MKRLFFLVFAVLPLVANTVKIDNFQTDIFSQNSQNLKKIKLDLIFDINSTTPVLEYKIKDALNIVISSFYIESLFTSKTKESFKELLKSYLLKKYGINVLNIYIQNMQIVNQIDLDELVKKLKKENILKKK